LSSFVPAQIPSINRRPAHVARASTRDLNRLSPRWFVSADAIVPRGI
jgi:hypothetical protein